jgi:hypothetical protein
VKPVRIVSALVLNMYSPVFGMLFSMAMVVGVTLTILALLPFTGLFILMVQVFSSTSIHFSLAASDVLAAVSFKTWRNVAVLFPQPAISWFISSSVGM